jgi:hypothetical protein
MCSLVIFIRTIFICLNTLQFIQGIKKYIIVKKNYNYGSPIQTLTSSIVASSHLSNDYYYYCFLLQHLFFITFTL